MVDHAFHYASDQEPLPKAIGRFQVVERAPTGQGSQGSVYKARDPLSGQAVAIKVLRDEYESYAVSVAAALVGEGDMQELRREAQLLTELDHPNIVTVLETGEDAAHGPYVVMEWMAGGDLKSRLDKAVERQLPAREALSIAQGFLAALAAAHAAGVIHGDIKPSNILLDEEGKGKLADFGIAWSPGATTGALPGRGTQGYMPPEQNDAPSVEAMGPVTDLYAVGVVLYEMLTGRLPSPGEEVRGLPLNVPASVARAIAQALEPNPQRRIPSAEAMAQALTGKG